MILKLSNRYFTRLFAKKNKSSVGSEESCKESAPEKEKPIGDIPDSPVSFSASLTSNEDSVLSMGAIDSDLETPVQGSEEDELIAVKDVPTTNTTTTTAPEFDHYECHQEAPLPERPVTPRVPAYDEPSAEVDDGPSVDYGYGEDLCLPTKHPRSCSPSDLHVEMNSSSNALMTKTPRQSSLKKVSSYESDPASGEFRPRLRRSSIGHAVVTPPPSSASSSELTGL